MARTLDPILKQDPTVEAIARMILDVQNKTHKWTSEIFRDWLEICLHAITRNEEEYMKIVNRYDKNREVLNLFSQGLAHIAMRGAQDDYRDFLGPVYEGLASTDKGRMGQYFTPWSLAYCMAQMNLGDCALPEDRLTTVYEPACGSGIMILAASKVIVEKHGPEALNRVHFTLIDLDYVCVRMAILQLQAYCVPNWVVYQGNALGDPRELRAIAWRGQQPKYEPRPVDEEPVEIKPMPAITISGEQITLF